MRNLDVRYEREVHQRKLAQWMIAQGARSGTVTRWTGLSRYQVTRLAQRHHPGSGRTRRGLLPTQTAYFGKSSGVEAESLAFVFIAVEIQVIPEHVVSYPSRVLPDLSRGQRLMAAFECYRAFVPMPHLSLERAILLVFEYTERKNLFVRRCSRCNDVMLAERCGSQHDRCPFCRKAARSAGAFAQPNAETGGWSGKAER
jgi:hypothetical protein